MERASQRIGNFKDFNGGELDAQWCVLGGLYLQYLYSYTPNDGTVQLENFSKFFTYAKHPFRIWRLANRVLGGVDRIMWCMYAVRGHG